MNKNYQGIEISGIKYFTIADIVKKLGLARQTIWRWRRERKIPAGHRFRGKLILFTEDEIEKILQFANRIEPISFPEQYQPTLFNSKKI